MSDVMVSGNSILAGRSEDHLFSINIHVCRLAGLISLPPVSPIPSNFSGIFDQIQCCVSCSRLACLRWTEFDVLQAECKTYAQASSSPAFIRDMLVNKLPDDIVHELDTRVCGLDPRKVIPQLEQYMGCRMTAWADTDVMLFLPVESCRNCCLVVHLHALQIHMSQFPAAFLMLARCSPDTCRPSTCILAV